MPTLALVVGAMVSGCASSEPKVSAEKGIPERYADYTYCEAPLVKQSSQRSCGAAVLSSVLRYWLGDEAATEKRLLAEYPPGSPMGYPLLQLKDMAESEGLLAFALGMDQAPLDRVLEHVSAGRPVIAALELPKGRYFGKKLPVIETVDRRTVSGLGDQTKAHYVVVMGVSPERDRVLLMDPQYGYVDAALAEFGEFWKAMGYPALVSSERPAGLQRH